MGTRNRGNIRRPVRIPNTPILQHSSTPSLSDLFLRFRFLDLLQQGEIDKILGLKLFCPWLFFRQKIERSLDTLEGRVGDGPKQRLSDIIAVIQVDLSC